MTESVVKIGGELLVKGYFKGPYTREIEKKDNEMLFVMHLADLTMESLQRNREKIGALLATEEDLTRHITIFAKELDFPIVLLCEPLSVHEMDELEVGDPHFFSSGIALPNRVSTADGIKIKLLASVSDKRGILCALENELDIGLLRTEFLLEKPRELYSLCGNAHFSACRLFDFEGDKSSLAANFELEHNRNVQMTEIMESSDFRCGILVPNVEKARQVQEYKKYIYRYNAKKAPPLGAMLETRSAIKNSFDIMRVTDFCSIGIHGLLRLGYAPHEIGSLCTRLVAEAKRLYLPLYACGEPDKSLMEILIKSGITRFVISLSAMEEAAKEIRNATYF